MLMMALTFSSVSAKTKVIIWGINDTVPGGHREQVQTFNKLHPDIELVSEVQTAAAGQTPESMQKLMTAIAAGNPPDITTLDRFVVGSWAARGALTSIDALIKRDGVPKKEDWVDATWEECKWDGEMFALPPGHDIGHLGLWSLYWNKDLFAEAGLDPEVPPKSWDDLLEYASKLFIEDEGEIEQLGFRYIWAGAVELYQFGWSNGGRFMESPRKATVNDPKNVEALEFMVELYDELGGMENIGTFLSSFQGVEQDPFLTGLAAMEIHGDWTIRFDIGRYKPDLNFGVRPTPSPDGEHFTAWGGGWSWVIPKGAKNVEEAWTVMKWLTSVEGLLVRARGDAAYDHSEGRVHIPLPIANVPANKAIQAEFYPAVRENCPCIADAIDYFSNIYDYGVEKIFWRPVCTVADVLWAEMDRACQAALFHQLTPQQAMDEANTNVQKGADEYWKRKDQESK